MHIAELEEELNRLRNLHPSYESWFQLRCFLNSIQDRHVLELALQKLVFFLKDWPDALRYSPADWILKAIDAEEPRLRICKAYWEDIWLEIPYSLENFQNICALSLIQDSPIPQRIQSILQLVADIEEMNTITLNIQTLESIDHVEQHIRQNLQNLSHSTYPVMVEFLSRDQSPKNHLQNFLRVCFAYISAPFEDRNSWIDKDILPLFDYFHLSSKYFFCVSGSKSFGGGDSKILLLLSESITLQITMYCELY